MMAQIKKKWVKKSGQIWINEQQKEVNAQQYVSKIIEQSYMKKYEEFEVSQKKLKDS